MIANVDDRSEAGVQGSFLGVVVGDDVAEGLDDEGGDEVMLIAPASEVCVKLFDVFVSHRCIAV